MGSGSARYSAFNLFPSEGLEIVDFALLNELNLNMMIFDSIVVKMLDIVMR